MKIFESGKQWPYAIAMAIMAVFGLGVWTIMTTGTANIQQSDNYMAKYQDVDANANRLIEARIAFDKKYIVKYDTKQLKVDGCDIKYKLTTHAGKPVLNANMILVISRPEVATYTKRLTKPIFEDDEYIFKDIKFPKIGRWNLMLKVTVGSNSRFYDVTVDTRKIGVISKEAFNY